MRWLCTLLASSHHSRHRSPELAYEFGDLKRTQHLAEEEYKALAGVWRAELELDDGDTATSLHLVAPKSLHSDAATPAGKVHLMDDLPFNIVQNERGYSSALWSAHSAGKEGDANLCLSLQLGDLLLEGRGERSGLRCKAFQGTVLEGGDDPYVAGRFNMQLSLPTWSDAAALEERYRLRLALRPAPPPVYSRSSFIGRWRLLLTMEDCSPVDEDAAGEYSPTTQAYVPIELSADCSWTSVGTEQTLGGTWGLYSRERHGWSTMRPAGSSVWLKVQRERSTETLRGVGGLPVRSDFYLSGKPVIEETVEEELAARADGGDADGGGAADGAPTASADRVDGRLWEGDLERSYFGRFSLLRGDVVELEQACDSGADEACDALSVEGEAKQKWLARLDAPAWGEAIAAVATTAETPTWGQATDSMQVAELSVQVVELSDKCDTGDDVACSALSVEAEARRLWLDNMLEEEAAAKQAAEEEAAKQAAEEAAAKQACSRHAGPLTSSPSQEEQAKRAWLAARFCGYD